MSMEAKKHRKCWTNFKGLWIPYEIMALGELSPTETVILALIHSYDNSNKPGGVPCYLDNLDFVEMAHVSKRTVISAINKLKDLGFIEVCTDQSRGNERFLYSQMVIDPKGRGKRGGSAKIAPPPNAKIAPADEQRLHPPSAKSAPAYNKEVNTDNTERETEQQIPLPAEGNFSLKSKEGLAVTAYLSAFNLARATDAEFLTFFHDVIFQRFNKWLLNSTDFEDWYEQLWLKHSPAEIEAAVKKYRSDLPSKVWRPDLKAVRSLLYENKQRANTKATIAAESQARAAAKKAVEDRASDDGMYSSWTSMAKEDAAAFIEMYNKGGFDAALIDSKPELKAALEKARKAVA